MNEKSHYLYARELAELYDISKQTLIFYDKINLLKPAFVGSNGYRMYSFKQFFILGIILDLKNMGLHLSDIQDFISNRNTDSLIPLLSKQIKNLEKKRAMIDRLCYRLQNEVIRLKGHSDIKLNEISLSYLESEDMIISEKIPFCESQKDRFIASAELLKNASEDDCLRSLLGAGFVFELDNLEDEPEYYKIFSNASVNKTTFQRPRSIYLQMYVNYTFQNALQLAAPAIKEFCQSLNIKLGKQVYIRPVKNYWTSDTMDTFISKIEIPVIT